jgi:hypothetical protein
MDIKKVRLEGMYLIRLVQNRGPWRAVVDKVMNLRVP